MDKINKIIDDMKKDAETGLFVRKMALSQRKVVLRAAQALIRVEEDVPENTYIKDNLRDAIISLGTAIEHYDDGLKNSEKW